MQSCLYLSKLGQSFPRRPLVAPRLRSIKSLPFQYISHQARHKHNHSRDTETTSAETRPVDTIHFSPKTTQTKNYGRDVQESAITPDQARHSHSPSTEVTSAETRPVDTVHFDTVTTQTKNHGKAIKGSAITPNQALANYLDIKDDSERSAYWKEIRQSLEWDSLPVMLIQYMHTARLEKWDIHDIRNDSIMDKRLRKRSLLYTDVIAWADILSAEDSEERIDGFFSTLSYYPSFLLLEVCRRDIHRVGTLKTILVHIWDQVLHRTDFSSNLSSSDHSISPPPSPTLLNDIEDDAFYTLLERLLHQCRRIWPSAMVSVAHLVSSYVDKLQFEILHGMKVAKPDMYRGMCSLQNRLLQDLAIPATIEPYLSMNYNWSAQKIILGLSSKFDPPLTLDQHAYQAVIQVLTSSKKSASEFRSATLRCRTWPAWRIDQDGMDAQREMDDDMGRSLVALMRKRESGYSDVPLDQVLSILGGQEPDGTPTIQTRAIVNTRYQTVSKPFGRLHPLHPDIWAARIKATRDVQEAWSAFTAFSKNGGIPNLTMFLAMFQKLEYEKKRVATGDEPTGAPGDGLEVFPVPDDNTSEFYRSSLQSPSKEQLYSQMLEWGIQPQGYCLSFLVRRASTISEGVRYLVDSGLGEHTLEYLHGGDPQTLPALDVRTRVKDRWSDVVPSRTTTDFIILLCRFAPRAIKIPRSEVRNRRAREETASEKVWIVRGTGKQYCHPIYRRPLQHAAHLLKISGTKERIAWYSLWKALSQRNIVLLSSLRENPKNFELAWRIVARSLQEFYSHGLELEPRGFLYICETFIKYAKVSNTILGRHHIIQVQIAADTIKREFRKLTLCNEVSECPLPHFMYSIHGVHMHAFVRSMAAVEDYAEILSTLEWMVLNADDLDAVADRSANGTRLTRRTLVAIRVFCEGTPVEEQARVLIESVESWNGWPTDEEVTHYRMGYEMNHVDESLADYVNDDSLEDDEGVKVNDANQLDRNLEDETEDFFEQKLVIHRHYFAGGWIGRSVMYQHV